MVGDAPAGARETESDRPRRPPWRSAAPGERPFPEALVELPVRDAARALLGAVLESTIGGRTVSGVIVETEAYEGPDDPASHASTRAGPTRRNRAMWGPPGHAYIYRSYGVHWCMNVVTGAAGHPQAVLIRGLEPLEGEQVMLERRQGRRPLAAGPGRVCMALGITDALYGHDLRRAPLVLRSGWSLDDASVGVSARVGVSKAADWPYRFYVRGSQGVSRPEAAGP